MAADAAVWVARGLALAGLATLAYGIAAGEVVDAEVPTLMQSGLPPWGARAASFLAIAVAGWLLRRELGPLPGWCAAAALWTTPAANLAGELATPDAAMALGAVAGAIAAARGNGLLTGLAGCAIAVAAWDLDRHGAAKTPGDFALMPLYAAAAALPWLAVGPWAWRIADGPVRRLAWVLAAAGTGMAIACPAFWLAGAVAWATGGAALAGTAMAACLANADARASAWLQRTIWGFCGIAGVAAVARIGTVYRMMEHYQGVAVAAAAAAYAAAGLRPGQPLAARSAALACALGVALAGKVVYVHAWRPERDWLQGDGPAARALLANLPPGATLSSPRPISQAMAYYLARGGVRFVGPDQAADFRLAPNPPSTDEAVRLFHGLRGERLVLSRTSPAAPAK